MLCDADVHFFSPTFFATLAGQRQVATADALRRLGWDDPVSPEALADRWVDELDAQGVARAAIIASVPGDEASVAAAVDRHPARFVGYFMLDPTRDDAREPGRGGAPARTARRLPVPGHVGAGPAGVSAAETIRAYDCESQIVMLSAEPYLPYSPPAMADHFIHGSEAHLWRDRDWLKQTGVDYRKGAEVVRIEPDAYRLGLRDGRTLKYDRLILATGSRLYAPVEGSDMRGVHNFKSLSAAEAIVEQVKRGKAKTAVIVGAGFIGMEIALLLRELGVAVTQIEMLDQVRELVGFEAGVSPG